MRSIVSTLLKIISVLFILIVVLSPLLLYFIDKIEYEISHNKLESTKTIGDQIIKAIDKYHSTHGKYPNRLKSLVPDYIDEIQNPIWGLREWEYRIFPENNVERFQLSVGANKDRYPVLFYDSTNKYWSYDQ
jgi:hypothetical protein